MSSEHISYAMRNTEATEAWISFNAPSEIIDWTHLAIEWMLIIGFGLTVYHALRYRKEHNSNAAVYTLIGALLYGLVMDIISYYTVENFWHGEFSVMFLFNKLPLYIVLFYPTFIYHAYMTIRRYEFSPLVEAICVGFFSGLIYQIFDNFGPQVGWWIWDMTDPTTFPYLSSVPLTSYHWFFLFTGTFAYLARRICWDGLVDGKGTPKTYLGVATIPVTTILLGTILFIPYNLFSKGTPPWDLMPWQANMEMASLVHAVLFSLAGLVFLFNYQPPKQSRDRLLMLFPLMFLVGHAYMYIAKFHLFFNIDANGNNSLGLAAGNLPAAILGIVAGMAILLLSHPIIKNA